MEEITEICGTVDRVVFKSGENNFSVISLKVTSAQSIMVRGYLPDLHQGAQVSCKGTWVFHKKFGQQFDAQECSVDLPTTAVGVQKYLGSGLIKGIGPKFAERLVKHFGVDVLDVIDQDPNRLLEVYGVGRGRVEKIVDAWQEQKEIAKVMVFLRSKGVSAAFAVKIFKTYGNDAVSIMQQNPYRLVDDIWGVGFKSADTIALQLGLDKNSFDRIKAAINFILTEATSEGHLYQDVDTTKQRVLELLTLECSDADERVKQAMNELYRDKKIILVVHQDQFFITLPQFHYSEKSVAQKINNLLSKDLILKGIDVDAVYQSLRMPDEKGLMLNEEQQRGIVTCLQSRVAIITGGPGTGKTTMIRRLIEVFERYKVSFKLAAPTGRAAKRMFESTGRSTETLHRLLEFSPGIMNFTRNEMNALECDVLVVDEASMIDIFLMNAIVKALPHNATLLLIGDIDQLPSVGPGNVLHDLIATKRIPTIRLQHIFRQAQDSFIIINAHRVNQGEFPTHPEKGTRSDFVYINKDKPEDLLSLLPLIYNKKLAQRGISAHDTMILTPMNRGVAGAVRLNQELQVILNGQTPQQESVSQFGRTFKVHDRVMQIRNNYDKFVFNGDIGVITSIHKADQKLIIRFGERDLEYDFAELNELMLAYAISIHKSQGSEFQAVIIPLFMQHFILLQRNLIYTAITRAKKLCIIIGQPRALAMGIKNDKGVDRRTFLKELLIDELEIR